jgi:uncharacterized protein
MTLTDAGPLVALIDADERDHESCLTTVDRLSLPLVTTWPAFTEAMYLLGRIGWSAQAALWRLVQREDLLIDAGVGEMTERTAALMDKYSDRPMDLADASLVALAEARGLSRIFTLDADFHIYRLRNGNSLQVLPA